MRALLAHEVERARAPVRGAPAGDRRRAGFGAAGRAASPSALYGRMLDRVEAVGFDVCRRAGVRVWHLPGAALEALR